MNIGIDIDDTVANTQEFKLAYGVEYCINELNQFNTINPKEIYALNIFEWDNETENKFFNEYFAEKMVNIQPKILSKEIINKLKEEGHNIYFITARWDSLFKNNALGITKAWLNKHGFKYDGVYANTKQKEEICRQLKIDLIIDNTISICEKASNQGIKTILFTSIDNENINISDKSIHRVYTWPEIYYYIKNVIN